MTSNCAKYLVIYLDEKEQVGTELGQAQLKLGLDFTLIFCTIKI